MEKKTIQVVVLSKAPADAPSDHRAKTSMSKPVEAEVGGRFPVHEIVECPNGHVFYAWVDTDYWTTCQCPIDGSIWQALGRV
jgi:hypothetical protein